MSVAASAWAWALDDVTPTQKLVLLCLADHYHQEKGAAWPSYDRIVKMTGLGRRTVIEAIRSLHAAGLIEKQGRVTSTNRQTANGYRLAMEGVQQPHPSAEGRSAAAAPLKNPPGVQQPHPSEQDEGCSSRTPQTERGVQLSHPRGCSSRTPGGAAAAPEPLKGTVRGTVTSSSSPSGETVTRHDDGDDDASSPRGTLRDRLAARAQPKRSAIVAAISSGDHLALLRAMGVGVTRSAEAEWLGAIDELTIGELLTVLHWRRRNHDPIRMPSGMRQALATWRALPIDDRRAIAAASLKAWRLDDDRTAA